ncbi:hypothetical protein B0H14DRAFT_3044450 [Mycena olivaceomarginata]|nr:hypothetical protein B0H14DRAFT_3044450 [Mycena olivaceomarginata]
MGVSGDPAIIVVLGSRTEGEKFAGAVRKADSENGKPRLQLVESYSQKPDAILQALRFNALSEIERRVKKHSSSTSGINVSAILFMEARDDSIAFPFKHHSRFLDMSGNDLFSKVAVVLPSVSYDLGARWTDWENSLRFFFPREEEPYALLRRILSGENGSDSSKEGYPHSTVDIQKLYEREARSCRRDVNQAVILLVGQSRHGKSKTINRLLGRKLLRMGQDTLGSTTKVIQRVKVQNTSDDTSATITLVFDDSPGLEDTTYEHQRTNKSLMRRYKEEYFKGIYPNVILLVASWDSITPDAHNDPPHFTSATGKTMYSLSLSNLVDNDRVNVVVVVTKCLSFWHQLDDFKSGRAKHKRWNIEAGRRMAIIAELQRKIFPNSAPWETFHSYPTARQAIRICTRRFKSWSINQDRRNIMISSGFRRCRCSRGLNDCEKTRGLAKRYLGVTCDHATGHFGRSSVLRGKDPLISWSDVNGKGGFLRAQYASSSAFESALTKRSYCYSLYHVIAVVSIDPHQLWLSQEMEEIINDLPQWSDEAKGDYMMFFASYGTHVVTKLALGGVIRVIVNSTDAIFREKALAYGDMTMSGGSTHKRSVLIFLDGGGTFAGDISDFLENNFPPVADEEDWEQVRAKWMESAKNDPVFCPDHKLTEYVPIYSMPGLSENRKGDLKKAYQEYMVSIPEKETKAETEPAPLTSVSMSRKHNLKGAIKLLQDAVADAFSRLLGQKRPKRIMA